ncbi:MULTISPECIES: MFS transporter [unclassified Streptomyces]|uniref:MFS transporter n=1 Tax=unclassified Streptomyces TaxID=2593676 RepID=UPI00333301A7
MNEESEESEQSEQDGVGGDREGRGPGRRHDFRLLWGGETVSKFGSSISGVAMPLVAVVTLRADTLWVSVLAAAAWLPWLLFGLSAGAWVDRVRRRPLMIACNLASLVLLASVPVAAWCGVLTMAQLLAVALLTGCASVLFSVAYRVYLPTVVAKKDLSAANAKLQGSESVAQLGGLGAGGLLAGALGAVNGLLADGASFLVSTLALLAVRGREPRVEKPRVRSGLRAEIREGLRYTLRDPYLRVLTVYGSVTNLLLTGCQAILTVFLVRELGVGEGAVGWLLAAGGVGGFLGALAANPMARRFGTARGMLLCKLVTAPLGLLIPLAGAGARSVLLALGLAGLSVGVVCGSVIQGAFRQTYCPPELLGRITASYSVANYGSVPVGALLGGALGTAIGLRPTLWLLTSGLAVSSLLLLAKPLAGRRDLPTAPAPDPTTDPAPGPTDAPETPAPPVHTATATASVSAPASASVSAPAPASVPAPAPVPATASTSVSGSVSASALAPPLIPASALASAPVPATALVSGSAPATAPPPATAPALAPAPAPAM